jgi:circadian clock protein KaiC
MHLSMMLKLIEEFSPTVVVIDPISNLYPVGDDIQVRSMLMRLIDYLKTLGITALFTNLSTDYSASVYATEPTHLHVSSLMDAWLSLKNVEGNGERNRVFSIIKARGVPHSNQVREFVLSDQGLEILDVYQGENVLFGTARVAQEARDRARQLQKSDEIERRKRELQQKRRIMENEIAMIEERFAREEDELKILVDQESFRDSVTAGDARELAMMRRADT